MRIFVSEFITSGALSGSALPESLLREGQAMLDAIVGDFLAIPGCQVATTVDRRLSPATTAAHVEIIDTPSAAASSFDRQVLAADVTLVIAPETDGVLAERVGRVHELGAVSLNCLPSAIELCGDKLRLAEHFRSHGVPTIETRPCVFEGRCPGDLFNTSCVVKPRDGAGSWLTFGIRDGDRQAWEQAAGEFAAAGATDRAIIQPWMEGQALSAGCLCGSAGEVEIFPIASQNLSAAGFQYRGGQIPADLAPQAVAAIEHVIRTACGTTPGLRGYIGIDLLLPDSLSPIVVEINPRLTTSYVGYRRHCRDNIARRMLGHFQEHLSWKSGAVRFDADGNYRQESGDNLERGNLRNASQSPRP